MDDRARAEGAVDAGLKAFPGDASLLVEAARIHLALGKVEQASGEAGRAIAADPKSVDARLIGARIALAENLPAMAWRNATQALALWPDNIDALQIRAVALGNLGRLTEMAATLDRVDQLQGAKPATRILRARLLAQQQRWQESSDQLALAGDAVRADPRTLLLSGEGAARLHKPESAIASLSAYLAALPDDAKAAELLAEQKLIVGDADGARKTLDPFLTRPDVSPGLLAVAARAAVRDHQPALAAKLSARSRYPSPQYLGKLILAANAAMQSERWGDAILLYQEVQNTTRAENIFVLNNLGWALFRANRTSEALRILAQAYRLNSKNASVVDSYGWVMLKSGGDRVRAVKLLQDAAALAPQNRLIQNHLSQATTR
jgi:tetratricopeptide (TPR) repeat protein